MEPKFQSSFIPKGPAAASPLASPYVKPKTTLFGFIGTLVFVLTLILSVGIFAYDRYLLSSIGTMGDQLTSARATMQPDTINELVMANRRLQGTRILLAQHTALSPFFSYLESATLKNVRYSQFLYALDSGGNEVTIQGQARSYADVAAQSDAFNNAGIFKNPVFSDLALDNKGNVTFTFRATLDPAVISYQKLLEAAPSASAVTASSTPALTAATTTATSTGSTSSAHATSTKTATH